MYTIRKAAIRRKYGPPNTIIIEDTPTPVPADNEVLIRVHATTVNRTDCANLTGKPFIMHFVLGLLKPRKITLGTDFAGEVTALGKHVRSIAIGDRVFGFKDIGTESQAEFITAKEDELFPIPGNIDYKHAAASLEGAHYAYTFVHKVQIRPGQEILINGATGAIGSALLQFCRQYDVNITATCNSENIRLIKALGADRVYDYTIEDFTEKDDEYDYIFDAVGKSTYGKCKAILKENGIYISSELGPYCQNVFYALMAPLLSRKVLFPVPFSPGKTIPYISGLLERAKFNPVIDREYNLNDITQAYDYVMSGQKTGNVLINIRQ